MSRLETTIEYEVWRSHVNGPDVRLYHGLSKSDGVKTLDLCNEDKATGYPTAPVEFHLVRAMTTRGPVTTPSRVPNLSASEGD